MQRGYEFRIYPDAEQRGQIESTFGCCRWVYNKGLEMREDAYREGRKIGGKYALDCMVPAWKEESPWLAQADSIALQQSLHDLWGGYAKFFDNVRKGRIVGKKNRKTGRIKNPYGRPVFKCKRDARQSYRTNNNKTGTAIAVLDEKHIKLPKLKAVKSRISQPVQGRITSATVKRTPTGKYFCVLHCEGCPPVHAEPGSVDVMGIDLGIHELATCSDGTRYGNPKHLKAAEKKLAREQRKLSRRRGARKGEEKSANFEKQRKAVARSHEKVENRRRDAQHKATTAMIRESQAVAVEDLNVKGMISNRRLAKAVSDAALGELRRQLRYKAEWYGRGYAEVGRTFASTQLCGACGAKAGPAGISQLRIREWTCPECGARHDRDLNAARNIAAEGRRILEEGTAGHAGTAA